MITVETQGVLLLVPIDAVVPNPRNPRRVAEADDEMVASIRAHGLIHPLVVRQHPDQDDRYQLLAGHRRLVGCLAADLEEVPVILRDEVTDEEALEIMLVENLTRSELAPTEEAAGYQALVELGLSQRAIAEKVGVTQGQVSKRIGLIKLPDRARNALDSGRITIEQAQAIGRLPADRITALFEGAPPKDYEISSAVQDHDRELKKRKEVEALKAAGVRFVDESPMTWVPRPGQPARTATVDLRSLHFAWDVDETAHASEPCHAAYVSPSGTYWPILVCTDIERHRPAETETETVQNGERAEPSAVAEARAEAEAARQRHLVSRAMRLDFARARLADMGSGRLDVGGIIELAAWTLPIMGDGLDLDPLRLLGVDTDDIDYDETCAAYHLQLTGDDDPRKAARLLLAIVSDTADACVPHPGHHVDDDELRVARAWLRWLTSYGYELDDDELSLLKRRTETEELEAAASAEAAANPVEVVVAKKARGKKWTVTCSDCGPISENTTEDFAGEMRAAHLTNVHDQGDDRQTAIEEASEA